MTVGLTSLIKDQSGFPEVALDLFQILNSACILYTTHFYCFMFVLYILYVFFIELNYNTL